MSATFWNMRRRRRAAAKAAETKATAPKPAVETVVKEPVKKGGGKSGK